MMHDPSADRTNGPSPAPDASNRSGQRAGELASAGAQPQPETTTPGEGEKTTIVFQPEREVLKRIGRSRRILAVVLLVLGLVVVSALAWMGGDYYLLSFADRVRDPRHDWLSPGGTWGHGLGIVATLLMLSNFFYFARKRWRALSRLGPVPLWLTVHVSSGLLSALVILFHAAFRSRNLIATFSYISLLIVVLTGLIGRYIYGLVPGAGGSEANELARLLEQWKVHRDEIRKGLNREDARRAFAPQLSAPQLDARGTGISSAFGATVGWTGRALSGHHALKRDLKLMPKAELHTLAGHLRVMNLLRLQIELFHGLKKLLATWRLGHSLLASFLVVVIVLHLVWSLAFGFRWIF